MDVQSLVIPQTPEHGDMMGTHCCSNKYEVGYLWLKVTLFGDLNEQPPFLGLCSRMLGPRLEKKYLERTGLVEGGVQISQHSN